MITKALFIGLTAGMFGGLVGLGGGIIMIPLMLVFLKLDQHQAHATSLVAVVFTGIGGALGYGLHGEVSYLAAALMAVPAMISAPQGARLGHRLPAWKLRRGFGAFTVLMSGMLLLKPYLGSAVVYGAGMGVTEAVILMVLGYVTGLLSGLMGIGGGSLMVPAMVLVLGMGQHLAQGTSLLAMILGGGAGAVTHWRLGNVARNVVPGLIAGVLAGTFASGFLANRVDEAVLRALFAAVLVYTGVRFLMTPRAPGEAEPA